MHYVDFAEARLREIDDLTNMIEAQILSGFDSLDLYQRALARRKGLLEARGLIVQALGRDGTGLPQS
jgi:hypothetical protein